MAASSSMSNACVHDNDDDFDTYYKEVVRRNKNLPPADEVNILIFNSKSIMSHWTAMVSFLCDHLPTKTIDIIILVDVNFIDEETSDKMKMFKLMFSQFGYDSFSEYQEMHPGGGIVVFTRRCLKFERDYSCELRARYEYLQGTITLPGTKQRITIIGVRGVGPNDVAIRGEPNDVAQLLHYMMNIPEKTILITVDDDETRNRTTDGGATQTCLHRVAFHTINSSNMFQKDVKHIISNDSATAANIRFNKLTPCGVYNNFGMYLEKMVATGFEKSVCESLTIVSFSIGSMKENWKEFAVLFLKHLVKQTIDVIVFVEADIKNGGVETDCREFYLHFGYKIFTEQKGSGSGIVLIARACLGISHQPDNLPRKPYEYLQRTITLPHIEHPIIVIALNRPSSIPINTFLEEFKTHIESINQPNHLIVAGNMNINLNATMPLRDSQKVDEYLKMLNTLGLQAAIDGNGGETNTKEIIADGCLKQSCIDHINVAVGHSYILPGVITHAISNHYVSVVTIRFGEKQTHDPRNTHNTNVTAPQIPRRILDLLERHDNALQLLKRQIQDHNSESTNRRKRIKEDLKEVNLVPENNNSGSRRYYRGVYISN